MLNRVRARWARYCAGAPNIELPRPPPAADLALDDQASAVSLYCLTAPSDQNALDIFKGEWASALPGKWAELRAGSIPLFADPRVSWFDAMVGGFKGMNVLELGPLEAGHTYMLETAGAESILSIEANTRAYLKCLVAKELLGLKRATFRCGSFLPYLQAEARHFDACLASGVLYHMINPVELLDLLAQTTDRLCLWTHYYDAEIIAKAAHLSEPFVASNEVDYKGFRHTLHHRNYELGTIARRDFCGGGQSSS